MKKIFLVFAAGFIILSCNEADKKAEGSLTSTVADSNSKEKSLDSLNKISNAANNPQTPQPSVDTANLTTIKWLDSTDRDFGKIKEGENLNVSFRFKNTGSKPLIISRVWAQCGCTVPETPQKPYAPGQTGVIKASFNSSGKVGVNSKEVYMSANTNPATNTMVFHVEVKPKS